MANKRILHLDIETAPMVAYLWSLKVKGYVDPKNIVSNGYVLCFSAKWDGEREMQYFDKYTCGGYKRLLRKAHSLLRKAEAVVHYNGKRFDIPTLNAEFALHHLPHIENFPVQVDLLPLIRKCFRLPSYKLDFVCGYFGLGHKLKHQGYDLWKKCMAGDRKAWKEMKRYNIRDVHLLPKLFKFMRPWMSQVVGYKRISQWLKGERAKP